MIRIEKPEFRGSCNCCSGKDNVKEIHFVTNAGGYNGTMIALCAQCRKELAEELERHGDGRIGAAIEALKKQQPRVLTIEETINAEYPMDVFAEVKGEGRIFAVTAPIIQWAFDPNIRFWTARPTEEQRKAAPWE